MSEEREVEGRSGRESKGNSGMEWQRLQGGREKERDIVTPNNCRENMNTIKNRQCVEGGKGGKKTETDRDRDRDRDTDTHPPPQLQNTPTGSVISYRQG